jgi:hypothetical protein
MTVFLPALLRHDPDNKQRRVPNGGCIADIALQ